MQRHNLLKRRYEIYFAFHSDGIHRLRRPLSKTCFVSFSSWKRLRPATWLLFITLCCLCYHQRKPRREWGACLSVIFWRALFSEHATATDLVKKKELWCRFMSSRYNNDVVFSTNSSGNLQRKKLHRSNFLLPGKWRLDSACRCSIPGHFSPRITWQRRVFCQISFSQLGTKGAHDS